MTNGRFEQTIFVKNELFNISNIKREIAWFAGLFAADGYVKKKYFHLGQSNDWGLEMMRYVKEIIGYTGEIKKVDNSYRIYFSSDMAETFFNLLNIKQKKSLTLTFPEIIKKDRVSFTSFVRGYFEGDGCIHVRENIKFLIVEFAGTKSFLTSVKEGFPKIKSVITKHNKNENIWLLRFTGQAAEDFLKLLYEDDSLYKGRKYEKWKNYILNISPNRKTIKYEKLRKEFVELYKTKTPMATISKKLSVAISTLYVWKAEYENPELCYWQNYYRNKKDS